MLEINTRNFIIILFENLIKVAYYTFMIFDFQCLFLRIDYNFFYSYAVQMGYKFILVLAYLRLIKTCFGVQPY